MIQSDQYENKRYCEMEPQPLLTVSPSQSPATRTLTPTPDMFYLWQGLLPPCLSAEGTLWVDEKCGEGSSEEKTQPDVNAEMKSVRNRKDQRSILQRGCSIMQELCWMEVQEVLAWKQGNGTGSSLLGWSSLVWALALSHLTLRQPVFCSTQDRHLVSISGLCT